LPSLTSRVIENTPFFPLNKQNFALKIYIKTHHKWVLGSRKKSLNIGPWALLSKMAAHGPIIGWAYTQKNPVFNLDSITSFKLIA